MECHKGFERCSLKNGCFNWMMVPKSLHERWLELTMCLCIKKMLFGVPGSYINGITTQFRCFIRGFYYPVKLRGWKKNILISETHLGDIPFFHRTWICGRGRVYYPPRTQMISTELPLKTAGAPFGFQAVIFLVHPQVHRHKWSLVVATPIFFGIFTHILGEDEPHFDSTHIVQRGWNHQLGRFGLGFPSPKIVSCHPSGGRGIRIFPRDRFVDPKFLD